MAHWSIRIADDTPTARFAADEFIRLLSRMDPAATADAAVSRYDGDAGKLWLGTDPGMPQPVAVEDQERDDAVRIDVRNCAGNITGTNPRSVLIGVYRFFREAGCAFVRPGRDGEYVPRLDSASLAVTANDGAAYRHRGVCIEGAVSYENVAEMIDWMPKLGMNCYMTQFFIPFEFFDRWYSHSSNPALLPTPVSPDTVEGFAADYGKLIVQRGMMHHGVGHGWTASVLGVPGLGWSGNDGGVSAERTELVAEVGGKRELWEGVAINTHLCYSNPRARVLMAEEIVSYAAAHRDIAYIHCWLADGSNNHCECPGCRDTRPADFYLSILNDVDARLTALGLPARIVFLVYVELLWPPERETFTNPDRFTLMFAPITRTYSVPMNPNAEGSMAPFVRNNIALPRSVGDSLAYLKAWKRVFNGDSFVFDYHYMWDHFNDPGYSQNVKVLHDDIENLGALGLNGYVSCQIQRAFVPNGLGMHMMGQTLWAGKTCFDGEADRYYSAAYGPDGSLCRSYFERLSEAFSPEVLRGEKPLESGAGGFRMIPSIVDEMAATVERNLSAADPCRKRSWEVLKFHGGLCRSLAAVLAARAAGDGKLAAALWEKTRELVCQNERRFQPELDAYEFIRTWEGSILKLPG